MLDIILGINYYCLLSTAYCLYYCLLPIAYCLIRESP